MSNIISLQAAREIKTTHHAETIQYRQRIDAMDKLALLEEMVHFQEERTQKGELTPSLMLRGRILFEALEKTAETRELQILTRSYRRHLEFELNTYLKEKNLGSE